MQLKAQTPLPFVKMTSKPLPSIFEEQTDDLLDISTQQTLDSTGSASTAAALRTAFWMRKQRLDRRQMPRISWMVEKTNNGSGPAMQSNGPLHYKALFTVASITSHSQNDTAELKILHLRLSQKNVKCHNVCTNSVTSHNLPEGSYKIKSQQLVPLYYSIA